MSTLRQIVSLLERAVVALEAPSAPELLTGAPWVPITRAQAREFLGISDADITAVWILLETEGRLIGGARDPARRRAPRGEAREAWIRIVARRREHPKPQPLRAPARSRLQ